VPGKRITDRQVNEYKRYRLMHGQEAAAAKAGMSVRTARRVERATSRTEGASVARRRSNEGRMNSSFASPIRKTKVS
jgi:hypothetical protein